MTQQFTRRLLQVQLAQRMAGIVIGNPVREGRTDVGDPGDVDQKLRKLKHPFAKLDRIVVRGGVHQQLGIKIAHHGGARCRGADDKFLFAEKADELFRQRPGLIPISRVECWLPATGLLLLELDRIPNPAQDGGHIEANLRTHLIHKARDQHRHFFARLDHENAADS